MLLSKIHAWFVPKWIFSEENYEKTAI